MSAPHNWASARQDAVQTIAPSAMSPVQTLLMCQRELLADLFGAANDLIDPLRSVLSHDPREKAEREAMAAQAMPPTEPPGCGLEEPLMNTNAQIADAVERLHQIRRAIRL